MKNEGREVRSRKVIECFEDEDKGLVLDVGID